MINPRMLVVLTTLVLLLAVAPANAGTQSCSAEPASATNVTIGDLVTHGESPGCSLSFRCRSDRADCLLKATGSVSGGGLVGVAVIVNDSAMAECWVGLGGCVTPTATRTIAQGEEVIVTCAFRNGISSDAIVGCNAELT